MACNRCSKNVEKLMEKKMRLSNTVSPIERISAWLKIYSPSFNLLTHRNFLEKFPNFLEEAKQLSEDLNLIKYLKQMAAKNQSALYALCIMAYGGLLKADENDEVWELGKNNGPTVAHWAAAGGNLNFPYSSRLWYIPDINNGSTPAHWAAKNGMLRAINCDSECNHTPPNSVNVRDFSCLPCDSSIWYIRDNYGRTPAHYAATCGNLEIPYESELWRIQDKWGDTPAHFGASTGCFHADYSSDLWSMQNKSGNTPAHIMAKKNSFDASYDFKLWCIQNEKGETPAHMAAQYGILNAPYDSPLWSIQDNNGYTPAHWAAKNGFLNAPYDSSLWSIQNMMGITPAHWAAFKGTLKAPLDSSLWSIQDKDGETPAHWAANAGLLNVPYDSNLWYIENKDGNTPAHLAAKNGNLRAPYDSKLWKIPNHKGETPAHLMAQKGNLNAPWDSDLWSICDKNGNTPAHRAAECGKLSAPYDSYLWNMRNRYGNTPAHCSLKNNAFIKAPYKSKFWFIVNYKKEAPIDLTISVRQDLFTVINHHSDKEVKQYFTKKGLKLERYDNAWDALGCIRVLLLSDTQEIQQNISYHITIKEIKPRQPDLCDFYLVFKNMTQPWLLTQILSNQQLCDTYCHAMAGALTYLLMTDRQNTINILTKNTHPYINDSILSKLEGVGLWGNIKQIMRQEYNIHPDSDLHT